VQALRYANISTLVLSETLQGTTAGSFPEFVAGTDIALKLRLSQRVNGENIPSRRTLHALKMSLGRADARPTSGSYQLLVEAPPEASNRITAQIEFDATAADVETALNALTGVTGALKPFTVETQGGSYRVRAANGAQVEITCVDNSLYPASFVNVVATEFDEGWTSEIRLTQAPVAQNVDFTDIVPDAPTVTRIQAGATDSGIKRNEIQKIFIPPEFPTGYGLTVKRGFATSDVVGLPTNAADLQPILDKLLISGEAFVLTDAQDAIFVEFAGDLSGVGQDLLEIDLIDPPPADKTFTLSTDTAETYQLIRAALVASTGKAVVPLELQLWLDHEQIEDVYEQFIFRLLLTFVMPVNSEAQNVSATVDWNQPRAREKFTPYSPTQVVVANRSYEDLIGDGTSNPITINHNLAGTNVSVTLTRVSTGAQLTAPADYSIDNVMSNSVRVTFVDGPPDTNDIAVGIQRLGAQPSWQSHTHDGDEVPEHEARLDAIEIALAALQALVPTGSLSSSSLTTKATEILFATLPTILEAFPSRSPIQSAPATGTAGANATGGTEITTLASLDPSLLPTDGGLLPAVLDAKDEALTVPLPDADAAFKKRVFLLGGSDEVDLGGGGGRKGTTLRPGEYAACDGNYWYRVARIADTEPNWYPFEFERELFMLAVTDKDLSLKRSLTFPVGFEVGVMSRRGLTLAEWQRTAYKNTRCQWQILFEHGTFATEAAAAGVAFTADDTTDKITAILDNCPDGTPVKLSTTVTLPGGLSTSLLYTRDTVGNERKLAATLGGAAIDITDAGTGTHTITPQTAGNNLKNVVWNATPMLSHTFQFTRTPVARSYSVRVSRSLVSSVDTISAEQVVMGNASAAGSAPSSANFAIRARLARFDIEDDVVDPRALVVLRGLNVEVIKGDTTNGLVTLKTA